MARITRRQFLNTLLHTGVCLLAGEALTACQPGTEQPSPSPLPPTMSTAPAAVATLTTSAVPTPISIPSYMRPALYYKKPSGQSASTQVMCDLCPRRCAIADGQRGECGVRENRAGTLYTMVYGRACAVHIDPIEKKPFYHYLPGSQAFSLATAGCNLHCLYCQNWQISQRRPEEVDYVDLPPEQVVAQAQRYDCPVIAYTYTEPTVFYEYMLDTARLAREKQIRSVVVSAGFINTAPLIELCQAVDAIKIDFKGYSSDFYIRVCQGALRPVLETMKTIRQQGIHLEIVTLVVPTLNDEEEHLRGLCRWIMDELGPDVPTHFSRFYPQYKLTNLPMTPVETLEMARNIALEEGIHYAYIGNVPGHPGDNTYCHHCGEMLIQRQGFTVVANHIVNGKCKFCGQVIPGVWA